MKFGVVVFPGSNCDHDAWMHFRFGPLDDPENGPRNRRIVGGVVSGIAHYGNCFGVPTVGGETVFERCFNGNPLVNVFALGVVRHEDIFYA